MQIICSLSNFLVILLANASCKHVKVENINNAMKWVWKQYKYMLPKLNRKIYLNQVIGLYKSKISRSAARFNY